MRQNRQDCLAFTRPLLLQGRKTARDVCAGHPAEASLMYALSATPSRWRQHHVERSRPSLRALTVAAIAVLGTSVRPVFRYPHMWRYLESRQKSDACTLGAPIAPTGSRQRRTNYGRMGTELGHNGGLHRARRGSRLLGCHRGGNDTCPVCYAQAVRDPARCPSAHTTRTQ